MKWVDDEISQRSIEYLIYVVMILTLNFIIYLNVILIELKKSETNTFQTIILDI